MDRAVIECQHGENVSAQWRVVNASLGCAWRLRNQAQGRSGAQVDRTPAEQSWNFAARLTATRSLGAPPVPAASPYAEGHSSPGGKCRLPPDYAMPPGRTALPGPPGNNKERFPHPEGIWSSEFRPCEPRTDPATHFARCVCDAVFRLPSGFAMTETGEPGARKSLLAGVAKWRVAPILAPPGRSVIALERSVPSPCPIDQPCPFLRITLTLHPAS